MAQEQDTSGGGTRFSEAEVAAIKDVIVEWLQFETLQPPFPADLQSVLDKLGLAEEAAGEAHPAGPLRAPVRSQ